MLTARVPAVSETACKFFLKKKYFLQKILIFIVKLYIYIKEKKRDICLLPGFSSRRGGSGWERPSGSDSRGYNIAIERANFKLKPFNYQLFLFIQTMLLFFLSYMRATTPSPTQAQRGPSRMARSTLRPSTSIALKI